MGSNYVGDHAQRCKVVSGGYLFKEDGGSLHNYVRTNPGDIGEGLVLMLMVRKRPPGWEKEVERFIVREKKNSYYLSRVYAALWGEYRSGS